MSSITQQFILASNNRNKYIEISEILSEFGIELITARDAGLVSEAEETGKSFEENALLKAEHAAAALHKTVIADDSGLCVDALDGRPGIFSARYESSDEKRIEKLLCELEGIPYSRRTAKFVCAVALSLSDGKSYTVRGEINGRIACKPAGENGFGYDPVFVPDGFDQTFAELPEETKNRLSHRAMALVELKKLLTTLKY